MLPLLLMSEEFRTIGLLGREENTRVAETLEVIRRFLEEQGLAIRTGTGVEQVPEGCDLAVVVGGDGSMLGAARALVQSGVPVLGVHLGRLGFLTDTLPERVEADLADILKGNYAIEERFLLDAQLSRSGSLVGAGDALNDVVVSSGTSARMMEFELYIDDAFIYSQRSDGLIVATPTGSTAYSLSAGGPIIHPTLNTIVLVPMFPHTLSSRPLMADGDSTVRIVIAEHNTLYPQITCDGQIELTALPGDEVELCKKPRPLRLLHSRHHDFYAACRDKLGWGKRLDG